MSIWLSLLSLISRFEAGLGDLVDADGLVRLLVGGDDGRVGDEREVDARVGHQVVLELAQVHVEGALGGHRQAVSCLSPFIEISCFSVA